MVKIKHNPDTRKKRISKYNIDYFVEKCNKLHNNKYDYKNIILQDNNIVDLYELNNFICPIHGEYLQKPIYHSLGFGCRLCSNSTRLLKYRLSNDEFIEKAKKVHGNVYDYSEVKYEGDKNFINIICKEHGIFTQKAGAHLYAGWKGGGCGCPKCNKYSRGEKIIFKYLTQGKTNFIPQYRVDIDDSKYYFDFYIVDINTMIEFQGTQHYGPINFFGGEEGFIKTQERDKIKEIYCLNNNINLLKIDFKSGKNLENYIIKQLKQNNI